ncbi:MAG: RNA polymerase sigma factor [Alphaproteobacteria bacterium]
MDSSDTALIGRIRGGDGDAFAQLMARHYALIFRLAFRVLGHTSDAEDLTQDICVALPDKLRNFRGDAAFTTWLYRVTANAATDRLRQRAAQTRAWNGWGEMEQLNRATTHQGEMDRRWLQDAMGCLSGELRETVALVLGEAMTHAEAAAVLQVSEGTVSWRMSEVRKALRAFADNEEHVE